MNGHANGTLSQLPDEMFSIIKSAGQTAGPRLGRLALPGRRIIETPHFLANASRGVVPHITQDTFTRDTNINGVYVALEDFIDKAPRAVPPLYRFKPKDGASPLRRFIALPDDTILVLGARRTPPVEAPDATSNTNTAVAICTAVGFRYVKADDYAQDTETLRPDILVALGDIPYGRALGNKRVEKATDRNIQWLDNHIATREAVTSDGHSQAKLFASLLPVSCAKQRYFVDELAERLAHQVSGLALYSLDALVDLPQQLQHLSRLGFTNPKTPQDILYHIRRGLDILVVPFVGAVTDAGIALDFTFGQGAEATVNGDSTSDPLPLGIDMWLSEHAVDVSPLSHSCECYACTNHHRAYLQHLLAAKEMLGWVLLQIHNHHMMDLFFSSIRKSIVDGTFDQSVEAFERKYESQLPAKTGQGPRYSYMAHSKKLMADDGIRVRGYQYKSEGPGEPKKNPPAFRTLDDGKEKLAEAGLPPADANADDLQEQGFVEKDT